MTVATLDSWDIERFRQQAFTPGLPVILPRTEASAPPAIKKWFIHDAAHGPDADSNAAGAPKLNHIFWSQYADLMVTLEVTRTDARNPVKTSFDRIEGPFSLLHASLTSEGDRTTRQYSIYLAQHDLRDLPQDLQNDLPMPPLATKVGKGDIYSSSLWLGDSPTYTPLHKDPNPNLLMQLAGTKAVRLFPPQIGNAVFEHAQQLVDHAGNKSPSPASSGRSASFRGEEMMQGIERSILHDLVWDNDGHIANNRQTIEHAQDAALRSGQTLFIPKGWWHSVKGLGTGVTASANWWFR